MQSAAGEHNTDGTSVVPADSVVQVLFPSVQTSVLENLNRQRADGKLCDLSIHVQGQVFKAHRCVLAASSPYFHDQVLLKNMSTVSIPAVMDPLAFESVLSCAYTGQLRMLREDIVNYLTIGSVLQMWHIVDKCTELLKEGRKESNGTQGTALEDTKCHANKDSCGEERDTQTMTPVLNRPLLNESQSPSSTNYFSPKDANFGSMVTSGSTGEGGMNSTPNYCTPSSREEAFLIEEEDEEDVNEFVYSRKHDLGNSKRKKYMSASDQEMAVSDSFGVSSYQDGESSPPQKCPMYSQPSIMPRKQWVVVKTEHSRDDDLIVVSGEEGGGNEDEQDLEIVKEREKQRSFNISNVRTLSADLGSREEMEAQVEYCQSSEDYLKFENGVMDQTSSQQSLENSCQNSSRAVTALLGSVHTAAARAQLFPMDMQGNQIVLYNQTPMDASPPLGVQGSLPGVSLKGSVEHGAVHLSGQGGIDSGLDGLDGNGTGSSGKVFMCHCGKRFTHKSMRDRHINMHLDLRPFHCPVCSKKFKMKHHLTEHMKTHTGLKPYDCHSCGKKFMWRDSFMRHRSHCGRHSGICGTGEAPVISPPHQPQHQPSGSDSTQDSGGRGGIPVLPASSTSGVPCLTVPGRLLGMNSQSGMYGHSSGVLGLEVTHSECGEEITEVCVDESSVTSVM